VFQIGNSLREARLRQGLDFPELEQSTKVRGKYLRALEEEQFELLPAQTYVKGFLRTYAETLGLDGQLYVDEYNSRHIVGEDGDAALRMRRQTRTRRQRRLESRAVVIALLGIAVLTALVIVAWKFGGGSTSQPLPTVITGGSPNAQPSRSRTPLLFVKAVRGSSPLTVVAGSATGAQRYQGTLSPKDPAQTFYGKRFWITVARPEALRFVVNGRTVRVRHGRPLNAIVTRGGIRPVAG
jgi:hypothetical protein